MEELDNLLDIACIIGIILVESPEVELLNVQKYKSGVFLVYKFIWFSFLTSLRHYC